MLMRRLPVLIVFWAVLASASSLLGQSCNQQPTAVNDAAEYRGEVDLWIDVLANDGEPDGEEVTVVLESHTCGSSQISIELDTLRLRIPLNETDDCSVSYYLEDAAGDVSPMASVSITDLLIFGDRFDDTILDWSECVGC